MSLFALGCFAAGYTFGNTTPLSGMEDILFRLANQSNRQTSRNNEVFSRSQNIFARLAKEKRI